MGRFFGTDGVRGLANRFPLDGNTAYRIAQLAAKHLLANHKKHGRPFFVAKDTRRSGDLLEHAVAAGAGGRSQTFGGYSYTGSCFHHKRTSGNGRYNDKCFP